MNLKILYISILSTLMLASCFKDEGNYQYEELNAPVFDVPKSFSGVGYANSNNFKQTLKFHYPQADSLRLMENTEVNWTIGEKLIYTGKTIDLPVDTIIKRAGLKGYCTQVGMVTIKNKINGMLFPHRMEYRLRPKFWKYGWVILSNYKDGSKLSYQRYYVTNEDGKEHPHYENYDNIFEQINPSITLKGKPIKLQDHKAEYINPLLGATAVLTEKGSYAIDNVSFTIGQDFKNEFIGNSPKGYFSDILFKSNFTYMVDNNGKLYVRKYSKNWLGGKFLSEPYVFDGKDSHISMIAGGQASSYIRHFYDSKNNRLLCLSKKGDLNVVKKSSTINYPIDLTNLGEGVEVIALANKQNPKSGSSISYKKDLSVMVYKKDNKIRVAEFCTDAYYSNIITGDNFVDYEIPITVNDKSVMWMPTLMGSYAGGNKNKYAIFYTYNNEFHRYDRKSNEDVIIWTAKNTITACKWFTCYQKPRSYNYLAVGTENGDFYLVETNLPTPTIVEGTKFNVGGSIKDLSCVGATNYY